MFASLGLNDPGLRLEARAVRLRFRCVSALVATELKNAAHIDPEDASATPTTDEQDHKREHGAQRKNDQAFALAAASLRQALQDYLSIRRQLGFKLKTDQRLLENFVEFLERAGAERITIELALMWACKPVQAHPSWWRQRLGIVRGFARYLATIDPDSEVPSVDLLAGHRPRVAPYIYAPAEIRALMAAARAYPLRTREWITFEYVLLGNVNDAPENAKEVAELLRGIRCKVNLIALNPGPGIDFTIPDAERVAAFQTVLRDAGIPAFVRRPRGRDIYAACGQLKRTVEIATTPAR